MTDGVVVDQVTFDVSIPSGGVFGGLLGGLLGGLGLGKGGGGRTSWEVRGTLFRPARTPECTNSVLLLLHGISQGRYAWDFPLHRDRYSVARLLASEGYPVVAIDRLGYPQSDRPPGHSVTVQASAEVTTQIVRALRAGSYRGGPGLAFGRVGLVGHSIGTEIAELCVGRDGGVDILVATGYTHSPSLPLILAIGTSVGPALVNDYTYFGAGNRSSLFYDGTTVDPAVMAEENRLANTTPSGEILSVIGQPSGGVMSAIRTPVLLLLAERDTLFPVTGGPSELGRFTSAPDRQLMTVPESGHVLFLHPRGRGAVQDVIAWLRRHPTELPAC